MQETPALEPDSSLLRSHHTTAIFHFALSVCNQVTFLITLTSEAFLKAALCTPEHTSQSHMMQTLRLVDHAGLRHDELNFQRNHPLQWGAMRRSENRKIFQNLFYLICTSFRTS